MRRAEEDEFVAQIDGARDCSTCFLKAAEASVMIFDFLKSTVRKNRMIGIAAIKTAISLYMPLAFQVTGRAAER